MYSVTVFATVGLYLQQMTYSTLQRAHLEDVHRH